MHTEEWMENERARSEDPVVFAREYEIDYFAGQGDSVYPRALQMIPVEADYDPYLGRIDGVIDPGVADPTSFALIQEDTRANRFRVFAGFENDGSEDADFWASVLTGIPVSGAGYDYEKYPGLLDLMDFIANLRQPITFYGDPYGKQKMGDGKRSFYDAIAEESRKISHGRNTIRIRSITKLKSELENGAGNDARAHQTRKIALNRMLPKLDFNIDHQGAVEILEAIQKSRYPERKDNTISARLSPIHDEYSHRRSMMEFWAVNINNVQEWDRVPKPIRPIRNTLSGRRR